MLLWIAFFIASLGPLISAAYLVKDSGLDDVFLYHEWVRHGFETGIWPVVDEPWVYPIGALVPMALLSFIASASTYLVAWWGMIVAINAFTLIRIRDNLPNGYRAAWWWVAFLLCLGPSAIGRIDAVAAAAATFALVSFYRRPKLAATLITLAGWIKVIHFAWLLPLFLISTKRVHNVLAPALLSSILVVGVELALGSGTRIFGFLTGQTRRGLQAESIFATPFSVARLWKDGMGPTYNEPLNTYEYLGEAASTTARVLDLLLIIAAIVVAQLVLLAHRRRHLQQLQLVALATFAMTLALIVFNKVGSPQFTLWLAAPLVLSFATKSVPQTVISWRFPLIGVLAVAALTQLIYPLAYRSYILGSPTMVFVGAIRNVLVVALLAWAVRKLYEASRPVIKNRTRASIPLAAPE